MSLSNVEARVSSELFTRKQYDQEAPMRNLLLLMLNKHGLQEVIQKSHKLDPGYLSWQQVRNQGVPVGPSGQRYSFKTGFEGYWVGKVGSQEELLENVLAMGRDAWANIRRLHKHSYQSRSNMEKTIRSEQYNMASIKEWMAIFGAQIARQRAQMIRNPQAIIFREKTKTAIAKLPLIDYSFGSENEIRQRYFLFGDPLTNTLDCSSMSDEDQLAFLTMQEIGKYGHPLLRAAIRLI